MPHVAEAIVQPIAKVAADLCGQIGKIFAPLRRQARRTTLTYLDEQKQRAAREVAVLADIVRQTAHSADAGDETSVAGCAVQLADRIDRFAGMLRERPCAAMLADTENLARQQPALFLMGAVAVGFVIGFVLTSAEDEQSEPGGEPR
jgi:hypothetical protein